jgi:phage repressor protein C with HTH and peptisase S24 domain
MTQPQSPNDSLLQHLAVRYPEKTFYLSQVFNDTTTSYKLPWFLGLLSLIQRLQCETLPLAGILTEMAVVGWHPVCLYRLTLGQQDKLQHAILEIQTASNLPPDANTEELRKFMAASPAARSQLESFRRYVPHRFLAPWFKDQLRGRKDWEKDRLIAQLAQTSQKGPMPTPYWLDEDQVRLNLSWRHFLLDNLGVVRAFAEYHFTRYLQARNPNVPGIVNKLTAPTERNLRLPRQFWQFVKQRFQETGNPHRFRNIYSDRPLTERFTIDHFLPWSFVAHDLLWNLAPVDAATNSSKGDMLPDLETYLPKLVSLHVGAIEAAKERPGLLEDYTEAFKLDISGLLALGEDGLRVRYRDMMSSQAQIAANQGFQTGWKLPGLIILPDPRLGVCAEPPAHDRDLSPYPSPRIIVEHFPTDTAPPPEYLPYYRLAVAAGGFRQGYEPDPEGWVNVRKFGCSRPLSTGFFVTRVVGKSMEPTIRDGAYCLFRAGDSPRQNRILLVQKRDFTDPETGGGYTVKRHKRQKPTAVEGQASERISLIPDNPDRAAFPVLEFTPEDDADLRIIAEFIQMLDCSD